MIQINCDIGERGADHSVDLALMESIGMANIACGGHAGDRHSVNVFMRIAKERGAKIAAHLSYPDRENFGRSTMEISDNELLKALDRQIELMPEIKTVKFHGALYNDANVDVRLARLLTAWMGEKGIREVVTPFDSDLAHTAKDTAIRVIREAFAERRYTYQPEKRQLLLVNRSKSYASIKDCDEAIDQALKIVKQGVVTCHIEGPKGEILTSEMPIEAETICVHSDSEIALDLVRRLASLLQMI